MHNNQKHSEKCQTNTASRQKEDRCKQQNLNLQNKFASLNDELGYKSEQLHPRSVINVDFAQHNVDNLNLQNSFVSIDDNEGEENHPRSVINVDTLQSHVIGTAAKANQT